MAAFPPSPDTVSVPDETVIDAVIDAVIFDCDGTLVDSEPLMLRVMVDEVARLGPTDGHAPAVTDLEGLSVATALRKLEERSGRPFPPGFEAHLRAEMATLFRAELKPIAGALELLSALRLPYCVATNGPRDKTELTLGLTGLLPLLSHDRIFSAVDLGVFKPAPDLFLHAARAMGVPPARCAVIEDSLAGLEAGLAAGMTVYALRPPERLPAAYAGRVRPLARLLDLLDAPWHR